MLSNRSLTRILAILSLGLVSFDRSYAYNRSCYEVDNKTVCYFQPYEEPTNVTWDEAWKVCKNHNSTLPVIENRRMEETLKSHVTSKTSLTYKVWLAGREIRTNVWQWLNGKPFGQQRILTEYATGSQYDANAVITETLEYLPSSPKYNYYYICLCTDCILCQNKEAIRVRNGCIVVNNDSTMNLFEARNRCLLKGGDLATFEEDEDLGVLQQNRSLFYEPHKYWIGLRQNWWIWNETDSTKEIKYSNWLNYENVLNKECIAAYLSNYKWSQLRCTDRKLFLCQTGKISETHELDASTPALTLPGEPRDSFTSVGAIIIGVIVFTAVVVIVSVIIALKKRRKRSTKQISDRSLPTESSYQTLQQPLTEQDAFGSNPKYAELQLKQPHSHQTELKDEDNSEYEDIRDVRAPSYLEIIHDH